MMLSTTACGLIAWRGGYCTYYGHNLAKLGISSLFNIFMEQHLIIIIIIIIIIFNYTALF